MLAWRVVGRVDITILHGGRNTQKWDPEELSFDGLSSTLEVTGEVNGAMRICCMVTGGSLFCFFPLSLNLVLSLLFLFPLWFSFF